MQDSGGFYFIFYLGGVEESWVTVLVFRTASCFSVLKETQDTYKTAVDPKSFLLLFFFKNKLSELHY